MVEQGKALTLLATVASTRGPRCPAMEGIPGPHWPRWALAPPRAVKLVFPCNTSGRYPKANEMFSLAARVLDPTALHDVGGRVRRRSAEASTLRIQQGN